jgi:hypothetical protein
LEHKLSETESRYTPITTEERKRLLELGTDLPQLCRHAATPVELKKRILRTILCEIVIDVSPGMKNGNDT